MARGPLYDSTVLLHSLAYDNLGTALSAKIQISISLIGMDRKSSVEPIVLVKRWDITMEKAKKTIQATTQSGIRTMLHPSLLRLFRINDRNLCDHHLAHPVFSDTMFASTCHCCLPGIVSCQHVFVTMSKRWYKVSSNRSSKMLHVT